MKRSRSAGGRFYYAVSTTGVYCRPGCGSRRPNRANVQFFDSRADAERAGFRPCKRCRPDAASTDARHAAIVARACRSLEHAERAPTLNEVAAQAGMSAWHFQRVFKQIVGVTPKEYAAGARRRRLRDRLTPGRSVTAAIYDAGFGSIARAYAQSPRALGMTPSAYRNGAAGTAIRYALARCALGWAIVAATERGICAIELGDNRAALRAQVLKRFSKARVLAADADFSALVRDVIAHLDAPKKALDLPLDIRGTAFQQRVWNALRRIPPGETASYADIARRVGDANAARAVARACAANTLAVAIPCHRAVRADGTVSGYRWGAARKRALLARERAKR